MKTLKLWDLKLIGLESMNRAKLKKNILTVLTLFLFYGCEDENSAMGSACQDDPSCSDSFSFMLTDLNTTSSTYCTSVGPDTWEGEIRLFYFSSNEQ